MPSSLMSSKRSKQILEPGVPSSSEYVLEGAKISLDLLKNVAAVVPVPYVRLAIEAAVALIGVGEELRFTVRCIDDLNKYVLALVLVMTEPFKDRALDDIPQDLRNDVEHLTADLHYIKGVLNGLSAQNKLLMLLFKRLNEEKVEECLAKLDESLNKFHVSREINNAVHAWEMKTELKAIHGVTQEALQIAQDGREVAVENLTVTTQVAIQMNVIHSALKHSVLQQTPHVAPPLPSREMPTKLRFFYGRDVVVEDVVRILVSDENRHVALLGPGGMGKTSIAITVMRHGRMVDKFGDSRFWVPCVEGRSPARFLDILASCLKITRDTGDSLSDILHELKASPNPRVMLLDNFETPWNLDGCRSEIEHILCALADLPHIALLVTMRSNSPPSNNIEWHPKLISALDIDYARQVYTAIHPDAESDPVLDSLLAKLGYMPLAVTLMAQLGQKSGSTPSDLLQTWMKVYTNMLDSGTDAKHSINVSISLSVYSAPMRMKPEAFTLLATLSIFPAGTQRKNLAVWAPTVLDIPGALAALTDTSLVDHRFNTVYVLPIIRSYMLHPLRLPKDIKSTVCDAIYSFMRDHKSEPGDSKFVTDVQELANEETNIQSILLDVIKQGFDSCAVDALLTYCWYQHWTRPRLDVIESVLQVSRSSNKGPYIAESLFCLGHMYFKINQFNEALTALAEAKDIFTSMGHNYKSRVAQCYMKLSRVYTFLMDADAYRDAVKAAQCDLDKIGDESLVADAQFCVGEYHVFSGDRKKARECLTEAQQLYVRLNKPMGVANCTYRLSELLRGGNDDKAQLTAVTALEMFERLDHREGAADTLFLLCRILGDIQAYDQAVGKVLQGIHIYRDMGALTGVGQGLRILGGIYIKMGQFDEARSAYEQAITTLRPLLGTFIARFETAWCLYDIAQVYRLQTRFEDAARINMEYEKMSVEFEEMGMDYWAATIASERTK